MLHPPGIALVELPWSVLGAVAGEDVGVVASRCFSMCLGAFIAASAVWSARRYGALAALTGGVAVSVWVLAVEYEVQITLEPRYMALLVAALIGCQVMVGRIQAGAAVGVAVPVVTGMALGAAVSVKVVAALPAIALLVWLAAAATPRLTLIATGGAVAGGLAVCLPFFIAAPQGFVNQVFLAQLGRPEQPSASRNRLGPVSDIPLEPRLGLILAAAAVLLGLLTLHMRRHHQAAPEFAHAAAAIGAAVTLLITPVNFPRYDLLLAPALAMSLSLLVAWLCGSMPRRLSVQRVIAAIAIAALTLHLVHNLRPVLGPDFKRAPDRPTPAQIREFLNGEQASSGCVLNPVPGFLIMGDAFGETIRDGCPVLLDVTGLNYLEDSQLPIPEALALGVPSRSKDVFDAMSDSATTYLFRGGDTGTLMKSWAKAQEEAGLAQKIDKIGTMEVWARTPANQ